MWKSLLSVAVPVTPCPPPEFFPRPRPHPQRLLDCPNNVWRPGFLHTTFTSSRILTITGYSFRVPNYTFARSVAIAAPAVTRIQPRPVYLRRPRLHILCTLVLGMLVFWSSSVERGVALGHEGELFEQNE